MASNRRRTPTNQWNRAADDDDDDFEEEEEAVDYDEDDEAALLGVGTNESGNDDPNDATTTGQANQVVVVAEEEALVDSSRAYASSRSVYDEPDIKLEQFSKFDTTKKRDVIMYKTTCLQCGKSWNWRNATKIVNHLAKMGGGTSDCAPCTIDCYIQLDDNREPIRDDKGQPIKDPEIHKRYLERYNERINKKKRKEEGSGMLSVQMEQHQAKLTANVQASKRRKTPKPADKHFTTPKSSTGTAFSALMGSNTPKPARPLEPGQTQIITTSKQRDDELSTAIADWVHSNGLPFSTVEDPKFKLLIKKARFVNPAKYRVPTRQEIGGRFLDENFKTLQTHQVKELVKDSNVFGVSVFVDLATIKKMPMLNVLASGVHLPTACLAIKDCTSQLREGKKKTGVFIASIIDEKIEMLSQAGCVVDSFFSDGGSNVVKAGQILMAKYKGLYAFHGAEHVMSLMILDVFKMRYAGLLKMFYRKIYGLFGGGKHEPYAVFCRFSALTNNEKKVTLLRPADTRMGGWVYCLARMFRLKEPLRQALTEENIKKWKVKPELVAILDMKTFWVVLYHLLRMLYGPLKILRLADRKEPGMDKLYYFVRLTDQTLEKYRHTMNCIVGLNPQVLKALDEYLFPVTQRNRTKSAKVAASNDWTSEFKVTKDKDDNDDGDGDDGSKSNEMEEEEEHEEEEEDEDDEDDVWEQSDDDEEEETPVPEEVVKRLGGDGREVVVTGTVRKGNLGDAILQIWEKRREPLCHPFAFGAWITSPCPEIMADAVPSNINQYHKNAVNELIMTWCGNENMSPSERSKLLNDFWEQHRQFSSKSGNVFGNDYIWDDPFIQQNRSYFWHLKHTLSTVVPFGPVAAKAGSKILGIGSAERAWKDVKQLKQGNRSHLSGPAVEKQATMYGAYSAQKATIRHNMSLKHGGYEAAVASAYWNDKEDFGALQLGPYGEELDGTFHHILPTRQDGRKTFKCFIEKFEFCHWNNNERQSQDALLKKYKGWKIIDHDEKVVLTVNDEQMHWKRREWYLELNTEAYDPNNEREEDWSYWQPNNFFFGCVYDYIQENLKDTVKAITLPGQIDRNKKWVAWNRNIPKET